MYPFLVESNYKSFKKYISQHREFVFNELNYSGAILFRGFDLESPLDFEKAVKLINPNLKNYFGGDSPRNKITSKVYTSTHYPSDQTISMHHEKSYSNHYPEYIFLFCHIEPEVGGETPIADGREIYKKMPCKIIDKFKDKKIKYIMNLHSGIGIGKSWQEAFEIDSKVELEKVLKEYNVPFQWRVGDKLRIEEIVDPILTLPHSGEKVFFSQVDQWHPLGLGKEIFEDLKLIMSDEDFYHNCKFGDDSDIDIEYISTIQEVVNKERVFFKWKKGDLLILNNLISMHGRMPFSGKRQILVAMT